MKFIRSLQGVDPRLVNSFLQEAIGDVSRIGSITEKIEKAKKKEILKKIFTDTTGCTSWEEACDAFPDYVDKIDDYSGQYLYLRIYYVFFYRMWNSYS